jgi:L-methionine (R)-S-oxide reductase
MSESIVISRGSKEEKYLSLLPQIEALITGEPDLIANMANITAALNMQFNWWWTGFYIVREDELVLGPFQGPIACTRIRKGRGVCGTAWAEARTLLVPDVNKFAGHIACSADAKSEIVVPVVKSGQVTAVLDVDSELLSFFDDTDQMYLEKIVRLLDNTADGR